VDGRLAGVQETTKETPKPAVAEAKKAEPKTVEARKGDPNKAAKKDEGRKRKGNGFKLFASQMLMFGGFAAGTYALLFKSEDVVEMTKSADRAILKATSKKA
jgi:hypothetical protein